MLDHLSIRTSPELHEATVAFYVAALAPLGYTQIVNMFDGKLVAFGATSPDFWISAFPPPDTTETKLSNAHFAFRAKGLLILVFVIQRFLLRGCSGQEVVYVYDG